MKFPVVVLFLPFTLAKVGREYRVGAPTGIALADLAPAPTPAPGDAELRRALDARQAGPVTCGWVSGRGNEAFTCDAGSQCIFNTKYSVFGCCSGDVSSCSMQTACFGLSYSDLYTADGYHRGCLDATSSACMTYEFGNSYSSFACGTTGTSIGLRNTIVGDSVTATGVTTGFFPAFIQTSGSLILSPSGSQIVTIPASVAATAAGSNPTGGSSGSSGSSGSGSINNNSNVNTLNGGSSLSTGAIIGIAVGGGCLLLAVALIGFFVRRSRNRRPTYVPQNGYGQPPPPSYPGPPPSQAPGSVLPPKQPMTMTQENMDAHLGHHANEWGFVDGRTPQTQSAARPNDDGIRMTEILPEEAVDERRRYEEARPMSDVRQTAVAPTSISHHVQGV